MGVGLVYVPGLEQLLEPDRTVVDLIEIEPQMFWSQRSGNSQLPDEVLRLLRRLPQQKVIHSVGCAVGGSQSPSRDAVAALRRAAEELEAAWISEHLSFTEAAQRDELVHTGFMLPPLQTDAGVRQAVANIQRLAAQLPVPLLVETAVNYLKTRPEEMTDGAFVREVVLGSQCKLLLDLHNIWTNARNGRQSVDAFLSTIPLEAVWEIHLAGGSELDGYWLDAHSDRAPDEIMALAAALLPDLPNLKAITFEVFPSFVPVLGLQAIEAQLRNMSELWNRHRCQPITRNSDRPLRAPEPPSDERHAVANWESCLSQLVVGRACSEPLGAELALDPGVTLLRRLVAQFRSGAIAKAYPVLLKFLFISLGVRMVETLLRDYLAIHTPKQAAHDEASCFTEFLRGQIPGTPFLEDVASYEEAQARADCTGHPQQARFVHDPRLLLTALAEGRLPELPPCGLYELTVEPSSEA